MKKKNVKGTFIAAIALLSATNVESRQTDMISEAGGKPLEVVNLATNPLSIDPVVLLLDQAPANAHTTDAFPLFPVEPQRTPAPRAPIRDGNSGKSKAVDGWLPPVR